MCTTKFPRKDLKILEFSDHMSRVKELLPGKDLTSAALVPLTNYRSELMAFRRLPMKRHGNLTKFPTELLVFPRKLAFITEYFTIVNRVRIPMVAKNLHGTDEWI